MENIVPRSSQSSEGPYAQPVPGTATAPASAVDHPAEPLAALIRQMTQAGGIVLHLSAGQVPRWRIENAVHAVPNRNALGPEEALSLLEPHMLEAQRKRFQERKFVDFALSIADGTRCRVNLFLDRGGISAVLNRLPPAILSLEELGIPLAIRRWCEHGSGLVLVVGAIGQGKTSTVAGLIDDINRSRSAHIITLEDPIEYIHESRLSLVNQRELDTHFRSFGEGLTSVLREDPDILVVGELRDLESISRTLELANTGRLVLATFHASNVVAAIQRMIDIFPTERQNQVRATLADVLRGVVAQTLCSRIGHGRVPAVEVLVSSPAIANLIRESKLYQIPSSMETGKSLGNILLNDDLERLVREHLITPEEAVAHATDREDLARRFEHRPPRHHS